MFKKFRLKILNLNQRGDTLVSVSLSILFIGIATASIYTVLNRTTNLNNASREREKVNAALVTQVEGLKALASDGNVDIFDTSSPPHLFCLEIENKSLEIRTNTVSGSSSYLDDEFGADQGWEKLDHDCGKKETTLPDSADLEIGILYIPDKDGVPNNGDENLFEVRGTWIRVNSSFRDKSVMLIRIHPLVIK